LTSEISSVLGGVSGVGSVLKSQISGLASSNGTGTYAEKAFQKYK